MNGTAVLIGLALGDAFGAPVEFEPPDSIAPQRSRLEAFPGGGPFGWAPGEFTDDTQMALVLAQHLLDYGTVEPQALAEAFADWSVSARDVGSQTAAVLRRVRDGFTWSEAVTVLSPDAAGNGSLMRVAPVALLARTRDAAMELAAAQSAVTHPNALCVDACRVYSAALWDSLEGERVPLERYAALAREAEVAEAVGRSRDPLPPRMSGYVVDTLAGALWAVAGATDFADAVWRAVSLGRDADTVGAISGALTAARFSGDAGIPPSWEARLSSGHPLFRGWAATDLRALAAQLLREDVHD